MPANERVHLTGDLVIGFLLRVGDEGRSEFTQSLRPRSLFFWSSYTALSLWILPLSSRVPEACVIPTLPLLTS